MKSVQYHDEDHSAKKTMTMDAVGGWMVATIAMPQQQYVFCVGHLLIVIIISSSRWDHFCRSL